LCISPSLAFADKLAADACAAGLPQDAKLIYAATAADFPTAADPRGMVRDKTKAMVQAGKIAQGSARDNAMAAGKCLRQLR
jgi:hypothetical protein